MTAKDYLKQAYHLNQRIDSKAEQIMVLNDLATKCTANLTGMPSGTNPSTSAMAETVAKIVDLKTELNADIDQLIDLQKKIITMINRIGNADLQIVLERRYLCNESFEKIALTMGYSIENVFILHRKALKIINDNERLQ